MDGLVAACEYLLPRLVFHLAFRFFFFLDVTARLDLMPVAPSRSIANGSGCIHRVKSAPLCVYFIQLAKALDFFSDLKELCRLIDDAVCRTTSLPLPQSNGADDTSMLPAMHTVC